MKNIALFASGSGSNFQAIMDAVSSGNLRVNVKLLICDNPDAFVIKRAERAEVAVFSFQPKEYPNKVAYEAEILRQLQAQQVDFIVLAGYMRLIGKTLLEAYEGRIINIHPSLLPSFPGLDAVGQALDAGVKVTGVTIHYVDAGMDTGPIIAQKAIELHPEETKETLQAKIHHLEHELYPAVLKKLME